MKLPMLRACLECFSFLLWIIFTIFSIALAGLGLEGIILAAFLLSISGTQPVHFPLAMTGLGSLGICVSILWRQIGVDHLHYLQYDSPGGAFSGDDTPSSMLKNLIREVEESSGYARNDARAKAKAWLMAYVASLDEEDILLARKHFNYLLPAQWGCPDVSSK